MLGRVLVFLWHHFKHDVFVARFHEVRFLGNTPFFNDGFHNDGFHNEVRIQQIKACFFFQIFGTSHHKVGSFIV